jgi:hypothetical protein
MTQEGGIQMKWEYVTAGGELGFVMKYANELGEHGWELVAVLSHEPGFCSMFFKRLKGADFG